MLFRSDHDSRTKIRNASILRAFEQESQVISGIVGLESDNVFIVCTLENLAQVRGVESQILCTIASVVVQSIAIKMDGNERHVRGIHGLNRNAVVAAIHICILNQILDGVNDLFENLPFGNTCFEHVVVVMIGVWWSLVALLVRVGVQNKDDGSIKVVESGGNFCDVGVRFFCLSLLLYV